MIVETVFMRVPVKRIRTASGHLQMGVRRQIREVKDKIYAYIHNTVPSYFLSTILKIVFENI